MDDGELALSFVNTLEHRGDQRRDLLEGRDGWLAWMVDAGLLERATAPSPEPGDASADGWPRPALPRSLRSPPDARVAFGEAHRLRAAIRSLLAARAAGRVPDPADRFALNRILAAAPTVPRLEIEGGTLSTAVVELGDDVLALLAPVARSALHLLTSVDPKRLRACSGRGCTCWFVDTSKAGRRRWCSMAVCGNRNKAARHRRRQARAL